jgi:hypothetical protein
MSRKRPFLRQENSTIIRMHLEQIPLEFQKLSEKDNLIYSLGKPASLNDILKAEQKLDVSFPTQIKLFYESCNGLRVEDPRLEILPLEQLHFVTPDKLNFATINGKHELYFDTSQINEAEQWDIVNREDYLVTKTMASFWSNRIWAWIKTRREIWKAEFNSIECPIKDPF